MSKKNKVNLSEVSKKSPPAKSSLSFISKWNKILIPLAIALITLIVFAPVLQNNFVNVDDNGYVLLNQYLAKPFSESIPYFFGLHYFVGNYHPLTMIVYAAIYHFAGYNPAAYHAVNLVIHVFNVFLVFWFIYLLSGKKLEVAGIVSLFFAIHPMHVESVAWVAELKDVLYTFFFIAGLISYHSYLSLKAKGKTWYYALTLTLFIFSALSKPAAITFPLSLLLIDFYKQRTFTKSVWIEKIPFFIISLVFAKLNLMAQTIAIANPDMFSVFDRVMFASYSLLFYIIKLIVPVNMSSLHPMPELVNRRLPSIYYFAPFIVLALFAIVYTTYKKSRSTTFGFLFYLLNIILVLQFMPFGRAITADRYSYVPYIGLFFLIAMAGNKFLKNEKTTAFKPILIAALVLLGITSAYLANARCKIWRNSIILRSDEVAKNPFSGYAYYGLGLAYNDSLDYKNGILAFEKAKQLYHIPYPELYNPLGVAYSQTGNYPMALKNLDSALLFHADTIMVISNLGYVYCQLKDYDKALSEYKQVLAVEPNNTEAYFNSAICYSHKSEWENSITNYEKAKQLSVPPKPVIYQQLSQLYAKTGNLEKAKQNSDSALIYFPASSVSTVSGGEALFKEKKYAEAIEEFKKGINANPTDAVAYRNIGLVYLETKEFKKSLQYFNKAVEYDSTDKQTFLNIAFAYHKLGDDISAKGYFIKAQHIQK